MIITTTHTVQGREIDQYLSIVAGEVVSGVDFIRDFGASLRNMFGGRSAGYEQELIKARQEAVNELSARAQEIGAHAVIGVDLAYVALGSENNMLMVTATGTAVTLK